MRLVSLLIVLLVVAWLVYSQLGSGGPGQAAQAPHQAAKVRAEAVEVQVDDQFARQAGQLERMEAGEAPATE
ncbi:MAG: hypothetical protein V4729_08145 [Pseudomonadota bacterium]